MAAPTWTTEDLPVLEAVLAREAEAAPGAMLYLDDVSEHAQLDRIVTARALLRLASADYVRAVQQGGNHPADDELDVWIHEVYDKARRAAGQWPPENAYASLMDTLQEQIDATSDADERGRLERFRDGVLGAGSAVATGLLLAWAQRQTGLT